MEQKTYEISPLMILSRLPLTVSSHALFLTSTHRTFPPLYKLFLLQSYHCPSLYGSIIMSGKNKREQSPPF